MSKMSQIAMLLDEEAAKLGYESVEEMEADGYEVSYEETPDGNLRVEVNKEVAVKGEPVAEREKAAELHLKECLAEEEEAHEAQLAERDCYVKTLHGIADDLCAWATALEGVASYIRREIK